jgi:hypothetical protein
VLPLVARRPKLSAPLVAGLMMTGAVVEGTMIALWPLAACTVAELLQPVVAPDVAPLPDTTGLTWTPALVAPMVLAAVVAFPLRGAGLAGPFAMASGLGWWTAAGVHCRRWDRARRHGRGGSTAHRPDRRSMLSYRQSPTIEARPLEQDRPSSNVRWGSLACKSQKSAPKPPESSNTRMHLMQLCVEHPLRARCQALGSALMSPESRPSDQT